jgi:tetratricopeptide (TPR) repeat protein
MTSRRVTRKQMRRDEFVTAVGRLTAWMEGHARETLIGIGATVLIAVGVVLVFRFLGQREENASLLLARGVEMLHAPVGAAGSPPGSPGGPTYASEEEKQRAVQDQMDAVLQTYPRSEAARLATYYKGLSLASSGKPREAAESLRSFLEANPESFVAPMARMALAQALEASGERDKALAIYEDLSRHPKGNYPAEAALLEMGRCLEREGKVDEARKVYERITREHPGSDYSREADQRLKELS